MILVGHLRSYAAFSGARTPLGARALMGVAVAGLLTLLVAGQVLAATTQTVDNYTSDSATTATTLRYAVGHATDPDSNTIGFNKRGALSYALVTLDNGTLNITTPVTLNADIGNASRVEIKLSSAYAAVAISATAPISLVGANALLLEADGGVSATALANTSGTLAIGSIGSQVTLKAGAEGTTYGMNARAITVDTGLAGTITATVTSGASGSGSAYGLHASNGITIAGGLSAAITATTNVDGLAYGLDGSSGAIAVTGGFTGSITAGAAGNSSAYGMNANSINIAGGMTGASALTVTAEGTGYAYGMNAGNGITITGGLSGAGAISATAQGTGNAFGLNAGSGALSLSGGVAKAVTATAAGSGKAYALLGTSVAISGGLSSTITATAGNSGYAYGICAGSGALTLAGGLSGTVTATAGTSGHAYGLYASGNINGGDASTALTISGTVSATAADANSAFAIYSAGSVNLYVTGTLKANDTVGLIYGRAIYAAGANNSVTLDGATLAGNISLGGGTLTLLRTGTTDAQILGVTSLVVGDGLVAANWTLDPLGIYATSTFGGATININSSLSISEHVSVTGNISNSGSLTFNIQNVLATDASYSGIISGSGSLTKSGIGALILSGANTYTGVTTVSTGTLRAGAADTFSSGSAVTVIAGAVLDLAGYSQTIRTLAGAGSVTLGSNAATVLTINDYQADSTFSGVISGAGGLTKTGTKTLTLSGANTYTGPTVVTRGTLQAGVANAFSASSAVTVGSEGTLALNGFSQTIGALGGSGRVTLGSSAATVLTVNTGSSDSTYLGVISGSGGLAKTGTGTLTLDGSNTYSGGTTISAGTLAVASGSALGTGAVTLGGGTLQATTSLTLGNAIVLAANSTVSTGTGIELTLSNSLSGSGNLTKSGAGTLILSGNNSAYSGTMILSEGTLSIASANGLGTGNLKLAGGMLLTTGSTVSLTGNIVLDTGGGTFYANGGDLTLSGPVSGTGSLTKSGNGVLTLAGASNYSGATNVTAGTLRAGSLGSFSMNSPVSVSAGATLDLNNFSQTIAGLSGGGFVTLGTATLSLALSTDSTFSGVISGTGGVEKLGPGALTLSGVNTYTGATTVSAGSLVVTGSLASASVDVAAGTSLVFGSAADTTYAGTITGGGTVTKNGAGTLALTGTNTYTGSTTITAGTLSLASAANLQGTSSLVMNGGTLAVTNSMTLGMPVTLNPGSSSFNTNGKTLTLSGAIGGTGSLTKTGTGALVLSGTNTYTGTTTVTGGTLSISSAANLQGTSGLVLDGGALQSTASLTLAKPVSLGAGGGTFQTDTGTTLTLSGAVTDAAGATGALTKTGSGVLVLAGTANTYSGPTTVSAGTLQAGAANAFSPNSAVTVNAGATLDANSLNQTIAGLSGSGSVTLGSGALTVNTGSGASFSFSGVISGTGGSLVKSGAGSLSLTGANTYTGGTTLAGGVLSVASDANLGAASGALTLSGGTLAPTGDFSTARSLVAAGGGGFNNGGNALTLSGSLTGAGSLTLAGSGTNTLATGFTGAGYTGTATLSAGTLVVASGAALGSASTLVVSSGALVKGVGTVGNLQVSGTVAPGNSPGTLTVSGNYVQTAAGLYQCELTPATGDKIAVTGTATLGGTLSILPQYTYYPTGTIWTIVTATGGVSGTYSTVTYSATPENWIFAPVYGANAVQVVLQRQPYAQSAQTAQASAVGGGLNGAAYNATGQLATLITSLDTATPAQTNYALASLTPTGYDAFSQQTFELGNTLTSVQRAGFYQSTSGVGRAFTHSLDIGPRSLHAVNGQDALQGAQGLSSGDTFPSTGRLGVYLRPFALHATQQSGSSQTGYESTGGGMTGGLVYRPSEAFAVGLAPAYANQSLTLRNVGGGQGTAQDWSLAFFGSYRKGGFYADALVRAGYDLFTARRNLVLSVGGYTAKAVWSGWNAAASLGGGYNYTVGDFTFGPVVSAELQRQHTGAYSESGAGTLGQSFQARDATILTTAAGLRLARTFDTDRGEVTPEIRVAWGAQWLDNSNSLQAAFRGNPLSAYTARTADQRYNSLLLDAGFTASLGPAVSVSARAGVELFRPGYTSQAASVTLRYSF